MRIREENRNMLLLGTVTLFTALVAWAAAVVEHAPAPSDSKPVAHLADPAPARVVGVPFEPNTNPREHR